MTKDILFACDGNPDLINGNANLFKISMVSDLIFDFTSGNDVSYIGIEKDQNCDKWALLDFQIFSDKELEEWSHLVEPSNPEEKMLEMIANERKLQEELENSRDALKMVRFRYF